MERTLYVVGKNSSEVFMLRYPRSLLVFCEFDLAYFAESAIAICDDGLKSGELDFDRVTELRNSLKSAHAYIENCIRTVYDKIVLDCWIDYVCRRDNVGTGTLWNRFMPCRTAFEKAVFVRLCEYRYNRAINEWLNLVRIQDYAKNKVNFIFSGNIKSAEAAAARRNYFDLMFSVTAKELGCRLEDLGVTKVFSVGRLPSSPFMFPSISKDVVKNLLADFDYSEDYSDNGSYDSISDQIAMDAFAHMKSGLAAEYKSYNITRAEMENSPVKVHMPCGFKAVVDLEIDALIESGGWLAHCKRCGRYFVCDGEHPEEYCSLYTPSGKTCLEIYELEHPKKLIPPELEQRFLDITDEMYAKVGNTISMEEYDSWKVYLDALHTKVDKGELPIEELEGFIGYSKSLDISRSNPVTEVVKKEPEPEPQPKPQPQPEPTPEYVPASSVSSASPSPSRYRERVVKPFIPKRIDRSELEAQPKPAEPVEEPDDEPAYPARGKSFFTSPTVQRQRSMENAPISHIIRAEQSAEIFANRGQTGGFTPFGQTTPIPVQRNAPVGMTEARPVFTDFGAARQQEQSVQPTQPRYSAGQREESIRREAPRYEEAPRREEPRFAEFQSYGAEPRREAPVYEDSPRREEPRYAEFQPYGAEPRREVPRYEDLPYREDPRASEFQPYGADPRREAPIYEEAPRREEPRYAEFQPYGAEPRRETLQHEDAPRVSEPAAPKTEEKAPEKKNEAPRFSLARVGEKLRELAEMGRSRNPAEPAEAPAPRVFATTSEPYIPSERAEAPRIPADRDISAPYIPSERAEAPRIPAGRDTSEPYIPSERAEAPRIPAGRDTSEPYIPAERTAAPPREERAYSGYDAPQGGYEQPYSEPPKPRVIRKNAAAISAYGKMAGAPVVSAAGFSAVSNPEPIAEEDPFKDIGTIFDVLEQSGNPSAARAAEALSSEPLERAAQAAFSPEEAEDDSYFVFDRPAEDKPVRTRPSAARPRAAAREPDIDEDGYLTADEPIEEVRPARARSSAARTRAAVREPDIDEDGYLTADEPVEEVRPARTRPSAARARAAVREPDIDEDEYLTADEPVEEVRPARTRSSAARARAAVREPDIDEDEYLTADEFVEEVRPARTRARRAAHEETEEPAPVKTTRKRAAKKPSEDEVAERELPERVTAENAPGGIWSEERNLFSDEDTDEELAMLTEKKRSARSNKTQRLFDAIMREPDDNPNVRKKR